MPARKKLSRSYIRAKKKKRNLLPLLVVFFTFIILFFIKNSHFWDGKSKLSLVIRKDDGNVLVSTFAPDTGEIINVVIPGDTEVELARKLGKTRIKNAWQIGMNANYEGLVLVETVTRNFKFPVYIWADKKAEGFSESNFASIFSAMITPYKTNLKVGDRVRLALFAISVKNVEREEIRLEDTAYLKETPVVDGQLGFKLTSNFPQNVLVVFNNSSLTKDTRAVIQDESGDNQISSMVAQVLEVEGAKVVQIDKKDVKDYGCVVGGSNIKLSTIVSRVFSCKLGESDLFGESDLINSKSNTLYIKLGKGFASRF